MRKALFVGATALTLLCATPTFAGFATSVSYSGPTGSGQGAVPRRSAAFGAGRREHRLPSLERIERNDRLDVTLENNGAVGSYYGVSPGTSTTLAAGTDYGTTFVQLNPGVNGDVPCGRSDHSVQLEDHRHRPLRCDRRPAGIARQDGPVRCSGYRLSDRLQQPEQQPRASSARTTILHDHQWRYRARRQLTANFNGFKELRVFTAAVPPLACLSRPRWRFGRSSAPVGRRTPVASSPAAV